MNKALQVIKNYLIKPLLWLVLVLFLLLGTFILAIRTPKVQNWAVTELAAYLTKITKHKVQVGYINISWLDELQLENVVIFDRQKNQMIKVGSLRADFDLLKLITAAEPEITEVWLDRPTVNSIVLRDSGKLNIIELMDAFSNLSSPSTDTSSSHTIFHIDKVHLSSGTYMYFDQTEAKLPNQFDYFHFTLDKINGEVDRLRIAGDTFEINVAGLNCFDTKTRLQVHEMDVFYRFSSQSMQFHNLKARIGKSFVADYLEFKYNSTDDFSDFNDKVTLKAHLDSSFFHSDDLALFAPALKNLHENFAIRTDLIGHVTDISFRNLDLRFGQNSRMKGYVSLKGLPNMDKTFVDSRFDRLSSNSKDLEKYVRPQTEEVLNRFGTISYTGTYVGFFKNFVAKGKFETGLGDIASDINIKIKDDEQHSSYQGKISTSNFLLGRLMGQEGLVGSIDMEGNIKGVGFSYANAKFELDATIKRIGINQYDYHNVVVEANLAKQTFEGKITSADSNARFSLNGTLDFRQDPYIMDFSADFGHVNLMNIKVLDQPISFTTNVNLSLTGSNLDELQGEGSFSDTRLSNTVKTISLDTLKIITEKLEGERYVNIFSDVFEINVDGDFSYPRLANDLPRLYKEYMMVIENKKEKVSNYYATATPYDTGDYKVNFSFLLKKTNPIISLFAQDNIKIADNTRLHGSFEKVANKTSFNMVGLCSKLQFGNARLSDLRLNYMSNKTLDHPFVDGSGTFFSQKQQFGEGLKTEGLNMELIWNNDKVIFTTSLDQKKNDNHLVLGGNLSLWEGNKDFFFNKIDLKILKTNWKSDSSRVIWSDGKINVKQFSLKNDNQLVLASGMVSDKLDDNLRVELRNFTLKPLGAVFEKDFNGVANGVFVFSSLMTKNFKLDFHGGVEKLTVDKFLIGNIYGGTDWKPEQERFNVDFVLKRDSIPNLDIKGYVKPFENNRLALTASLDKFNLQSFEPFVKDYFSNLTGACSGVINIDGTLLKPNVTGKVRVSDGKFKINFLATSYTFTDDVVFDTSSIRLQQATLVDTNGNTCVIDGGIKHKRFKDITFDIKAKYNNLLVLNTVEKQNSVFYGKALVTGSLRITGPLDDILIYVNAKNEKGSELFIPINTSESLGGSKFITFVQKKKVINPEEEEEEVIRDIKPSQTTVKLDLDLNPSMAFSLILDKQTGDVIKGTGSGSLKLNTSTSGDFSLTGIYTFKKGFYNFTLLNLVNKKFEIDDGSNITWGGDPLAGVMDIKAHIEEQVSLKEILPETDTAWFNNQAIIKRYPTDILLFLKGKLMQPEITYKIKIKDYPIVVNDSKLGSYPLDNYVRAFLQQLDANEQQLNRQVFSVLVLRKFFPTSSTPTTGGLASQGAVGTVSSLLSSQLSTWMSQVDNKLSVDINLNGFNTEALNDLRLKLSYQPSLFGKRIRITRDGSFTNAQNNRTAASVAGDWIFEYLITRDGVLRLKMFTKNNSNNFANSLNNSSMMSTGFSFMHTQSFDNLDELIRRSKKKEDVVVLEEDEDLLPVTQPIAPVDSTKTKPPDILLNEKKEDESK